MTLPPVIYILPLHHSHNPYLPQLGQHRHVTFFANPQIIKVPVKEGKPASSTQATAQPCKMISLNLRLEKNNDWLH